MMCRECGDYSYLEEGYCPFCWREKRHVAKVAIRKLNRGEVLSEIEIEILGIDRGENAQD